MKRIGGKSAVCCSPSEWKLQLMEQLINLNMMISSRMSISLWLSKRLFISLSEIGWQICERLVGEKLLPSRRSCGTDVPRTIKLFQEKKCIHRQWNAALRAFWIKLFMLERTFRDDIMTQFLPVAVAADLQADAQSCILFRLGKLLMQWQVVLGYERFVSVNVWRCGLILDLKHEAKFWRLNRS